LFSSAAKAAIVLDVGEGRRTVEIAGEKKTQHLYVYMDDESVKGKVVVNLGKGVKEVEHQGIRVDFIGQIELFYDRGNHHQFLNLSRELAPPGKLLADQSFEFDFSQVDKKSESYNGINARLRYFVKFVITRSFAANITAEQDIWVIRYDDPPEVDKPIKMEVGIEDCLHIEFEYLKSKYHLKDVVIGKIYFLLVRLKIKYMELALQKRETTGAGPSAYSETETLTKFEIMDGVPVKGESIPVRLFLGAFDLTPTYRNIQDKFTVKYTLNLVLVDEEDRRYFKQHEIQLWRKRPGTLVEQDATRHTARHAGSRPTETKRKRKSKKNADPNAVAESPSSDPENESGQNAASQDQQSSDAETHTPTHQIDSMDQEAVAQPTDAPAAAAAAAVQETAESEY
jgi:hypothetical protein